MFKNPNEQLGRNEAYTEAIKVKELAHKLVVEAIKELQMEYAKKGVLGFRQEHSKKTGKIISEEESWFRLVQKHLPGLDPTILIANRDLITEVKREIDIFGQGEEEITEYHRAKIELSNLVKHKDQLKTPYFYQKASKELNSLLIKRVLIKLKRYLKEKITF